MFILGVIFWAQFFRLGRYEFLAGKLFGQNLFRCYFMINNKLRGNKKHNQMVEEIFIVVCFINEFGVKLEKIGCKNFGCYKIS